MPDNENQTPSYLPHHPVINPHKSKIRVLFDCTAKHHQVSLNDRLVGGPDLMNNLPLRKQENFAC